MTKEELSKVPFRMVSHMAMEGEHYSLYANDDYGFRMQKTTKIKKDGFTAGKTYTDITSTRSGTAALTSSLKR